MLLKNLKIVLDEAKIAAKYKGKTVQFLSMLDNHRYDNLYYVESEDGDTIVMEKDYILNSMPVSILSEIFGGVYDISSFLTCRGVLLLYTDKHHISVIRKENKIKKLTERFWQDFELSQAVAKQLIYLKEGHELVLSVLPCDKTEGEHTIQSIIMDGGNKCFKLKTFKECTVGEDNAHIPYYSYEYMSPVDVIAIITERVSKINKK